MLIDSALEESLLERVLEIDLKLDLSLVDRELFEGLSLLHPFGMSNPEPVFASFGVRLKGLKRIGRNKEHLKIYLANPNGSPLEAVGFHKGHLFFSLLPGSLVDIAYSINLNKWRGNSQLQLQLKDVKIAS